MPCLLRLYQRWNFIWRTRFPDNSGKPGTLRPRVAMMAGVVDTLWSFDRFFGEVLQYEGGGGMNPRNSLHRGQYSLLALLGATSAVALYTWAWGLGEVTRGIIAVSVGFCAIVAFCIIVVRELCK